jgi:hypothetical protein
VLSDWLGDVAADLLGDLFTDRSGERRAKKVASRQLAAFASGKVVRVRCRFRVSAADRTWRHGSVRLSKGRAAWTTRFARVPAITLSRSQATAVHANRRGQSTVLCYRHGGSTVEFAVRGRDLAVIGRVLDLPPFVGR